MAPRKKAVKPQSDVAFWDINGNPVEDRGQFQVVKPIPTLHIKAQPMTELAPPAGSPAPAFVAQPRMNAFVKGAKIGAMKAGANKLAKLIADPIKDAIIPKLREQFPGGIEVLGPAIELTIECIVLLGAGELAVMATGLIPTERKGEMEERGQMIAQFLREYAGEKAGTQLVEAAMAALPLVLAHFAEVSTEDMRALEQEPAEPQVETQTENQEVGVANG